MARLKIASIVSNLRNPGIIQMVGLGVGGNLHLAWLFGATCLHICINRILRISTPKGVYV